MMTNSEHFAWQATEVECSVLSQDEILLLFTSLGRHSRTPGFSSPPVYMNISWLYSFCPAKCSKNS